MDNRKTIYLDDAIDALIRVRKPINNGDGTMTIMTLTDAVIRKVLEGLPSAQPEIIRCGQCKYAEVADKEDAQDGYTCQFHRGSVWFSGSYCSWAEREKDE